MKTIIRRALLLAVAASCSLFTSAATSSAVPAQPDYTPSPENLAARAWFQDAKFGLFVHWGVYCQLARGEWVMNQDEIPVAQYQKLPSLFNPVEFDPDEWVSLVKAAGMKYITITSKHHDGFAMFDSPASDYDIVDQTPYGQDVMKLLKAACDRQGIKLFFYYSQLDWHHPDYFPRGRTGGRYTGRPNSGEWDNYIDTMNAQLIELLTQYGDIGGIWFDGMWDKPDADWQLAETYELIHRLQPGALVGSNHHKMPFPGEDFQMFERDLPGQNSMGFNQTGVSRLPLETCETMNGSWGFNLKDTKYKSTHRLIQTLVRAAGAGSNLLLNTGPMDNGKIQPENVATLRKIGAWMEQYGSSIYGTRAGPISPRAWGASTQKDNTVYLHLLETDDESIVIPELSDVPKSIRYFDDGSEVESYPTQAGIVLRVPSEKRQAIDTIIIIEM